MLLATGMLFGAAARAQTQIIGDNNTVVFSDVSSGYWAENEIKYFASQNIIDGYDDGTFKPSKGITRAETVVLLNRATKQAVTNINADIPLFE